MARVLVTGAHGFVGRHLVSALVARGDDVVALDVAGEPNPDAAFVHGDITDLEALVEAFDGVALVFHNASVVHTRTTAEDFVRKVNIGGTDNVLEACRRAGVPALVYVSSASVVYEGKDIEAGDETLPYAQIFHAPYAETKRIAEERVLKANDDALATCAIRPHVIFGPGDTRFIPAVLEQAAKGKLRFMVGRGDKLSDFTYIDNLIDGLLKAGDALEPGAKVAGEAYFITNGEPRSFWDFVAKIAVPLGYAGPKFKVPFRVAYGIAAVREKVDELRGREVIGEEGLSRFAIRYICTHHYFSHQKATRDFGYDPAVKLDEAIQRTLAHLRDQGLGAH